LGCRWATGDDFEKWGWRIPFLLSAVLLAVSVYIRLQLHESPVFQSMKEEGTLSKAPLTEALGKWSNLKLVLLALFGATAGQAVVWYGGQFYALFFIEKILQVAAQEANLIVAAALLLGTPLFVVFGSLSDRIGRKPIILAGMVLAVVTYFPVFKGITHFANPALESAVAAHPVTVMADPADCSFQFDPVGKKTFSNSCDVAKTALAKAGVPYVNEAAPAGTVASVRLGNGDAARVVPSFRGEALAKADFKIAAESFSSALKQELKVAGYPAKADLTQVNYPMVVALCTWLMVLVAMVYGPIAAWLVELFPASVRYTSMSLPYHLGNGWFGGFLPTISFALVAASGNIYQGLWYPIIVAAISAVIGAFMLHETHRNRVL
jgi:MFS family permease